MKLSTVLKAAAVAAVGYAVYAYLSDSTEAGEVVETLGLPAPEVEAPSVDDVQSA